MRGPPVLNLEFHQGWVRHLVSKLMEPEVRHHIQQVNSLIEENGRLLGKPTNGFNYQGRNWGWDCNPIASGDNLSLELIPKMARLVQLDKSVDFDKYTITQFLDRMSQPCKTIDDLRNVFPECLVSLESDLSRLPRTRPEAWTIQNNPRDLRQYQKVLTKIETYCAMRLLY